jgi:hypothetical protein
MNTPVQVTDWLKDFEILNSQPYEEKPETYPFDLLESAVVLKTLAPHFADLSSPTLLEAITPEVTAQADAIRKFYTRQWFWTSLSGGRPLSSFRQRAHYLLESRTREVLKKDIGIYVKLPWFYEEDMIYNEFKKTLKTTSAIPTISHNKGRLHVTVTFLKTSNGWQGKRKLTRYWFKDDADYLYGIDLEMSNPLIELFDEAVRSQATCSFETFIQTDRIDQMYFYKLNQYKLLKEVNA